MPASTPRIESLRDAMEVRAADGPEIFPEPSHRQRAYQP